MNIFVKLVFCLLWSDLCVNFTDSSWRQFPKTFPSCFYMCVWVCVSSFGGFRSEEDAGASARHAVDSHNSN